MNEKMIPPKKLGRYYKAFADKLSPKTLDENGVPLLPFGPPLGPQYSPVLVSQYALGLFNRYIEKGREEDRESFLALADWFVRSAVRRNDFLVWEYRYDLWKYNARAPWISGMAQGEALSVLLRAYELTEQDVYRDAATQSLGSFEHEIEKRGVRSRDRQGRVFYEEVAADPPAHILNGFISALWGLEEYHRVFNDSRSLSLFNAGIQTLNERLADYDNGYWTRYSLFYPNQIASTHYHRVHILQMGTLFAITGQEVFGEWAERWRRYQHNVFSRMKQAVAYRWFRLFYLIRRLRTFLSLS
ncbi:MAG: D-glucuronyl C5-epimerase family protein [Candidatus Aminicenantes bacterium]|nr:D-glucuronyl C5-epimerase family protein [Candidatus Aminicenantes bacterium]